MTMRLISERGRRGICAAGVMALLAVLALQLVFSVRKESLSWDEGDHIFAGYMSCKRGDFGLNPEHPPLVKMVAALPLLPMSLNMPSVQNRNFKLEAYFDGRDFIFGNDAEKIIFRARMAAMSFTLLLALVVFLATREMFGTGAGFIALTLVVFEPNLLAHGALVTTDAGLACFLIAAIYAFYRYVKAPSAWRLIVTGIAAGLAAATKHSAILLLPILALLALTEIFRRGGRSERDGEVLPESRGKQALRLGAAIAVVTGIAVVILWGAYGFRYRARPGGMEINPPLQQAVRGLTPLEARGILSFAHWHLLPESYLYGLADVRDVANFMPSYIFGKVYAHGVWFYFPVAFVIKGTLAMLGLLLLAIAMIAAGGWRSKKQWRRITAEAQSDAERGNAEDAWNPWRKKREIFFLTIPPLVYLAVSMGSRLNIGARHILLVFIFAAMLGAGEAWNLIRADRRWAFLIAALVVFHVVSSARAFPTSYMAYSNELWGGPAETYKYLTDANTDWGQQLIATKKYLDQRGVKQLLVCIFCLSRDPAGQLRHSLPAAANSGYELVRRASGRPCNDRGAGTDQRFGANRVRARINVLNPYRQFQGIRPSAVIEHGIFVFDGTFSVPMASALGHVQRARRLYAEKQFDEALKEARAAEVLAPDALQSQMALGDALRALGRGAEADAAYKNGLTIARTMEPAAQTKWTATIQEKLATQ